jgi:hypothetical protein
MAHDRARRKQVHRLFSAEWDHVGITGGQETHDEYDDYALHAYSMAAHGKTAEEIADYLVKMEAEYMGLGQRPGRRELCRAIAEKTIAIALQKPS